MKIYIGEYVAARPDIDYNMLRINSEHPLECRLLDGKIHILNAGSDVKRFHVGYLRTFKKKVSDGIFKYREFANVGQEIDDYICIHTEEYMITAPIDEIGYHVEDDVLRMKIKFQDGFLNRLDAVKIYVENSYFEAQHERIEDNLWSLSIRICSGNQPIELVIRGEGFLLRRTL